LDATNRLARDWPRLLLQLREAPQLHQRATTGITGGNQADPVDRQARATSLASSLSQSARSCSAFALMLALPMADMATVGHLVGHRHRRLLPLQCAPEKPRSADDHRAESS
jgi:hypothetical protein